MGDKKKISLKYILKNTYLFLRKTILKIMVMPQAVSKINPADVGSVVAIRIDRIGDVVVSLPALKALKEIFPQSHLAVVIKESNIALVKNVPWIDEAIPYRGFRQVLGILHKKGFSMAIDLLMDYSLKTALLVFLSRAKVKVGFDIQGRGRFFNVTTAPSLEKKQMSKHLLDLVRLVAGVSHIDKEKIKDTIPELFVSEEDKAYANDFLKKHGVQDKDVIFGVHPGGWFPSQRWPLERFAQLAEGLSRKYNAKIVVMGSSHEKKLLDTFVQVMKIKPIMVIGFTLDKLAAIIAQTGIVIANNSGLLHIAAALRKPTVSIMGPTDPYLWWPQGDNQLVIRHTLGCSPCSLGSCKKHSCMLSISVEEMEKAVEGLISNIAKKPFKNA